MNFDHYLFDLDGTIVATKEIHHKSFNQALSFFNTKIIPDSELSLYEALPSTAKIDKYNRLNNTSISLEEFIPKKNFFCLKNIENAKNIYDSQIYNIFKSLKQKSKTITICSNCTEYTARIILDKMDLHSFINNIYHNKSCKPKPAPDMYRLAVNNAKIDSAHSIIFEDSEIGIKSALNSFKDINIVRVNNPDALKLLFDI